MQPQIHILRFGVCALYFTSPQTTFSFFVILHGVDILHEDTQTNHQLIPLDGAQNLKLSIQRSKHPVLRHHKIFVEIEHDKTHRTEKVRHQMSLFEKINSEGNQNADESVEERCWTDCSRRRQEQVLPSKREKKKCAQFHSVQPAFTAWWKNEKIAKN